MQDELETGCGFPGAAVGEKSRSLLSMVPGWRWGTVWWRRWEKSLRESECLDGVLQRRYGQKRRWMPDEMGDQDVILFFFFFVPFLDLLRSQFKTSFMKKISRLL